MSSLGTSPTTTSTTSTNSTTTTTSSNPDITNANPGFNPTQSSTLYLFTFLATLLLLLAVSCAIVIRSFILRRRFRRRIEEAIAAGVLIPGALDDTTIGGMGRARRRDFGEKPKLWEVWIDDLGQLNRTGHSRRDSFGKNEGKWEDMMPISAMVVPSGTAALNTATDSDMSPPLVNSHHLTFGHFLSRLLGRYPGSSTSGGSVRNNDVSEDDTISAMGLKEQTPDDEQLQIAVLISMPNANNPTWGNNDSSKGKARGLNMNTLGEVGEIPDVVFGVTNAGYQM